MNAYGGTRDSREAATSTQATEEDDDYDSDDDNERWPDLRGESFDLYKALHITPSSNGGFSGGATRARACYHKAVLRCPPQVDWLWNLPEPTLSCATCCKRLDLGRNWYHQHADPPRDEGADAASADDACYSKLPRNSTRNGLDLCVEHHGKLLPEEQSRYTKLLTLDALGDEEREVYANRMAQRDHHTHEVTKFFQVAVAFLVLKDPERARIYADHGYASLVLSEAYAEESVFDWDPYELHAAFFRGDDEDDRQYLLLNADQQGGSDDDDDGAMEEEALAEETENAEFLAQAAAAFKAEHTRFQPRIFEVEPPPRPPVSVCVSMGSGPPSATFSSAGQVGCASASSDLWTRTHNQFANANAEAATAAAAIVAASGGKDAAETTDVVKESAGAEDKFPDGAADESKLPTERTRRERDSDQCGSNGSSGQRAYKQKRALKIARWKMAQAELQSGLVSFWGYRFEPDNFTAKKLRKSRRRMEQNKIK